MCAYEQAMSSKLISHNDNVVLFNCATGLKYPLPEVTNMINKDKEINYTKFI
jgi:threonine synthase